MLRYLIGCATALFIFAGTAFAQNCPNYSNTLTNGTLADANQVMNNFNSILTCANNNLAPLANPNFSGAVAIKTMQVTPAADGSNVITGSNAEGTQLFNLNTNASAASSQWNFANGISTNWYSDNYSTLQASVNGSNGQISGASITDSGLAVSSPVCTNGSKALTTGAGCTLSTAGSYTPSIGGTLTSTTYYMMGLGSTLWTPKTTGRMQISIHGNVASSNPNRICEFKLAYADNSITAAPTYGTGTTPAVGTVIAVDNIAPPGGGVNYPAQFYVGYIVAGLTLGHSYWADLQAAVNNTVTCSVTNVVVTYVEL